MSKKMKNNPDNRLRSIMDDWMDVFRRFKGLDDKVVSVCPECQFEDRHGHSPICPLMLEKKEEAQ